MKLSTQPYKGSRDFYPEEMKRRKWLFNTLRQIVGKFGYDEYDGPLLESFDLYAAKTGEEIVNSQLYHFVDRGDRKVAIRPEMTPTMARMVAARVQELSKPIRWYSIPNLWRYERPQRGRLREHWQLNVDLLGGEVQLADFEVLLLAGEVFKSLGGGPFVEIKVNHRGIIDAYFAKVLGFTLGERPGLAQLIDAREKLADKFDQKLMEFGMNATEKAQIDNFFDHDLESLLKTLSKDSASGLSSEFESFRVLMRELSVLNESNGLTYKFDPSIMRGMDYYTGVVFEAFDKSPENRRALFGGGRYDNLVGMFAKTELSGIGFGLGDVTLFDFLETHQLLPNFEMREGVFICLSEVFTSSEAAKMGSLLRSAGLRVMQSLENTSLKAQLKVASKAHVRVVVIVGEDERKNSTVSVKDLTTGTQTQFLESELVEQVSAILNSQA